MNQPEPHTPQSGPSPFPDLPTFRSIEINGGFWPRFIAYGIDSLALGAAMVAFALLAVGVLGLDSELAYVLVTLVAWLATPLMWSTWGTSPGKAALGMKIVHAETGNKLSFWRALGRYLAYIPSSLVFCLGFAWIGWDEKKQGWHDKLANTRVVRRKIVMR